MRARVKSVEDMPDWVRCCAASLEGERAVAGLVVELQGKPFSSEAECSCGARRLFTVYAVKNLSSHDVMDVSLLDIEEGS